MGKIHWFSALESLNETKTPQFLPLSKRDDDIQDI